MKIKQYLFVTTHFEPDFHFGGVVESSVRLFKYLQYSANIKISTVSKDPKRVNNVIKTNGVCYKSIYFHRFAFSFDAILGLFNDVKKSDVLLINGIFTFPVTLAQFYAIILRKPFVVAVRGGLEPWRVEQKKWKKFLYIKLITLPLMRKAIYIHVTSDMEENSIKELGFNNTIKVTNGIDLDMYNDLPDKYSYEGFKDNRFIFLFMSRTDKEKGLDILIDAYRILCLNYQKKNFLLLIVGPDHQDYLKNFNLNYENENIKYINGVYGTDKIKLIRRSDVVVLPSYSENFGNIIAEAFACERPVVTTTGTPWNMIEKVGCGFYINPTKNELFDALQKAYLMENIDLENMGKKGSVYIRENFNWKYKALEMYSYLQNL